MRSHHRMEGEYFAKHDDMQRDSESSINQCSPNLDCQMIVEMLFPLGRARERLTRAVCQKPNREKGRKKQMKIHKSNQ